MEVKVSVEIDSKRASKFCMRQYLHLIVTRQGPFPTPELKKRANWYRDIATGVNIIRNSPRLEDAMAMNSPRYRQTLQTTDRIVLRNKPRQLNTLTLFMRHS